MWGCGWFVRSTEWPAIVNIKGADIYQVFSPGALSGSAASSLSLGVPLPAMLELGRNGGGSGEHLRGGHYMNCLLQPPEVP